MNLKPYAFLCFLIAPVSLLAQDSMSLQQAQDYAVEHAYSVLNSQFDQESASRQVKETISIGLPQINGTIDYQNFIDIPTQVAPADAFGFPTYLTDFLVNVSQETGVSLNAPEADPNAVSEFKFGASQTMTAGISVSQLIFDGSYFVGLQAAKAYVNVMGLAVEKAESDIRDQVAQAYHTVIIADENVRILEESKALLTNTLEEIKQMVEAGFGEEQDVDQIQLSVSDLESRINYAQQQKTIAKDLLKFQMGMPFSTNLTLTDNVETLMGSDMEIGSMPFTAMKTQDYIIQSELLNLQELNMQNEKARGLPSIGAFYNYQRNAQREKFNFLDFDEKWYPIQVWGVQLNMPIFNSLQGKHRIEKARVEVERAKSNLNQIEQASELEYKTALNEYSFAQQNMNNQAESKELAQRIFNKTQIKYQEGLSSSMDLTQAENQLLSTQGNYINAVLQLLNAKSRLKKALNNY
jgi:outer membrane protein